MLEKCYERVDGAGGLSTSQLIEIGYKVYDNREERKEREDHGKMISQASPLVAAVADRRALGGGGRGGRGGIQGKGGKEIEPKRRPPSGFTQCAVCTYTAVKVAGVISWIHYT